MRGVLLLVLIAACGGPPAGAPAPGETRAVGTVRVAGSLPAASGPVLSRAGAPDLVLSGEAAAELAELAGAEVEVRGRREGGVLHASGYRLLRVDGEEALLGVVERGAGGELRLRLEDGSLLMLAHAPPELRPGQKVWVQGPAARALSVQRFGVVRPATPPDR